MYMDNPSAFPVHAKYEDETVLNEGMTLRDYFAAKAMPLAYKINKDTNDANIGEGHWVWDAEDWAYVSETAYAIADAMMKEREK
jgi:hypothetical protein